MDLLIACSPADAKEAAETGLPVVYLAYKADKRGLLRCRCPEPRPGDMICVDMSALTSGAAIMTARQIAEISDMYSLSGICISPACSDMRVMRSVSDYLSHESGVSVFVPDPTPSDVRGIRMCTGTVTGGTFADYAAMCVSRYRECALLAEWSMLDFELPSPNGGARILDSGSFREIRTKRCRHVYMSDELCSEYFCYSDGVKPHVVLFESERGLKAKKAAAEKAGFKCAFAYYPHVKGVIRAIL